MIPTAITVKVKSSLEKINFLIESISSGRTLFISTATRTIKITPATLAKWQRRGDILFRADDKSMYIASGKKFECIDYATLTLE